jgi:hypothetical protein
MSEMIDAFATEQVTAAALTKGYLAHIEAYDRVPPVAAVIGPAFSTAEYLVFIDADFHPLWRGSCWGLGACTFG